MLMQDLRYAARALARNPGFTFAAVGSLALAIGGSMAVFTLLNAVVLRSLPVYEPDRVFQALRVTKEETVGRHAWPSVERARKELAGRAEVAAASNLAGMQLEPQGRGPRTADRGTVELVSGEVLRAPPSAPSAWPLADGSRQHYGRRPPGRRHQRPVLAASAIGLCRRYRKHRDDQRHGVHRSRNRAATVFRRDTHPAPSGSLASP